MGVRPSRGTVGDAYDNAMAESFFATLECGRLDRRGYRTHTQARLDLFQYIEGWYNPHRRHSGLGNQSPITYEQSRTASRQRPRRDRFAKAGQLRSMHVRRPRSRLRRRLTSARSWQSAAGNRCSAGTVTRALHPIRET